MRWFVRDGHVEVHPICAQNDVLSLAGDMSAHKSCGHVGIVLNIETVSLWKTTAHTDEIVLFGHW